jgi:topoisomerase-4 subunit A
VIAAVYWDGEVKQHFVKRFQVETNSLDKEFGFISEGIGSRLEFVTSSDTPEIEIELVKGKGKGKETEVVNLEDIIDVKGWKAMGNRLSQFKVTKVKPVEEPEDTGLEEGDDDNLAELSSDKATETGKGSSSSKKKSETNGQKAESPNQESLFGGAREPEGNSRLDPKKQKAEQASLFGEAQRESQDERVKKVGSKQEAVGKKECKAESNTPRGKGKAGKSSNGKAFGVGETIELEL